MQTGTLSGTVRDQGGLPLPGVAITVTSPALQGARVTASDANGVYALAGLPPGAYAARFELQGMRTTEASQRVDLGRTARVDITLQVAIAESVQVTATAAPAIITSTQGGANLRADDVAKLANIRTVWGIAELAPGLTDNTPNPNQLTIGGGFAYDNQFLINGVDVADNIFGTPNNLFIEDALQEVQVLTSGISAEFGRFGGGVVNAVTKSGGNTFSGSTRLNFYSPSWTRETPFETSSNVVRQKDVQQNYEWTFGGPVAKDRLWFFTAGRWQEASTPAPLPETGVPFSTETSNKRGEFKLTATVSPNHTVQGSYLNNSTRSHQAPVSGTIELAAMVNRQNPNNLWVTSYRGVLRRHHAGHDAGVRPALRRAQRRRHRNRHPQLALPHARRGGRSGQPVLSRAVSRLDGSGGPQQPAGHRVVELVVDLGAHGLARREGRIRELRQPVRGRQLADRDRLRVPRRLRRGGWPPGARLTGACDTGVHPRRDAHGELAAEPWSGAGDRDQLALRSRPLDGRAAPLVRPRHPLRDGAERRHGRHLVGGHAARSSRASARRTTCRARAAGSRRPPTATTPASTPSPTSRTTPTWATRA